MLRLPPSLRPRLTWRYILCSIIVVYVSNCFLFSSPLFASRLPRYTGPYAVGTIDIEALCAQRSIGEFKRKGSGDPALPLDTVLFSLYYPATNLRTSKPLHYWIPKPISITAEGYLRFGHVNNFVTNSILTGALWSLAGGITIPAAVDIPLDSPIPILEIEGGSKFGNEKNGNSFPVFVFSHGFASSRTDYTHYLGEIASRGYIVAAIEHRDGSGPGSVVMRDGANDKIVFPIRFDDLEEHPELDPASFKKAQLDSRQAEVEETIRVLREINDGTGEKVYQRNPRKEGRDLGQWEGRLNMNEVTMGGHSFGATLAVCRSTPSDCPIALADKMQLQALNPATNLSFNGGIALDP
jgi:platelet-activating factor acetylhydrolase